MYNCNCSSQSLVNPYIMVVCYSKVQPEIITRLIAVLIITEYDVFVNKHKAVHSALLLLKDPYLQTGLTSRSFNFNMPFISLFQLPKLFVARPNVTPRVERKHKHTRTRATIKQGANAHNLERPTIMIKQKIPPCSNGHTYAVHRKRNVQLKMFRLDGSVPNFQKLRKKSKINNESETVDGHFYVSSGKIQIHLCFVKKSPTG